MSRIRQRAAIGRWMPVLALSVLLVSCGDDGGSEVAEQRPERTSSSTTEPTTTTTEAPAGALVAEAVADAIDVFESPEATEPQRRITAAEATSAPGIPIVFLVKSEPARPADRLEVYLPVRPNGSTGWVRSEDVTLHRVTHRIEVAIAEHTLRVFDEDELIFEEPIGVGRQDRPTPGGVYYLKELLQPPSPDGPYGTYAYGLSGFSNVVTSFNGGQGVIGIHGTNDPSSIGSDVSSGCIRLQNEDIDRLVHDIGLPLGTPVEILP